MTYQTIPTFEPFPKIPRWSRDIVITEKIDGTNATIYIDELGPLAYLSGKVVPFLTASRTRWIQPENDNAGFSKWAYAHADAILRLGPGYHRGEWWGPGIQRGYPIPTKRFSLFNVGRYTPEKLAELNAGLDEPIFYAVPTLYQGSLYVNRFDGMQLLAPEAAIDRLKEQGSVACPGFMRPEGIVIYHAASGSMYKKTVENDEKHKGEA